MKKDATKKKASKNQKAGEEESFECVQCTREINDPAKALFVEEENGRVFCSEKCIVEFFSPEITRLEEKYFNLLRRSHDFSGDEREKLSYLRWNALEHPDEIWCEKTVSGDLRYTLIGEYEHEGDDPQAASIKVWCVCITLLLRGEPSFLYLAFVSRDPELVNEFKIGEKITLEKPAQDKKTTASAASESEEEPEEKIPYDGLATPWTREETLIAETVQERTSDDIQYEDFSKYDHCVEATLQAPDEVWRRDSHYHFLKRYANDPLPYWYVIVAKETEQDDQLEIVDAFPTRDENLASKFRVGSQENTEEGGSAAPADDDAAGGGRMIH